MNALASIRSGPNHVNRQKKSYSPYSYDPHVTCDHCKRKGHTKAIYFRLVGYLPDFERRRRENQLNNYSDKGSNYLDKGNYYSERGGNTHTAHNAAHNVVNNPVKYQEHTTHFSGNMDYNKGMEVIHEQYNQILHMLGKTNLQGTSDMTTSSQGPINDSANSIQSSNTAGNSLKLTVGTHDWIVDSGATNHMTYKSDMLVQKKSIPPNNSNQVYLPNGHTTTVTHTGSCNITEHDNIDNELVIPEFKNNLLSVSKLTRDLYCSVSFFPDFFCFSGSLQCAGEGDW